MLAVAEALDRMLQTAPTLDVENIPLEACAGRVLRESLTADRDMPPFNRVAMDGIAVHSDQWGAGLRAYTVEGIQASGAPARKRQSESGCVEVMTGAVLPEECDAVLRYEDLSIQAGKATVDGRLSIDAVKPWLNVHRQGQDSKKGQEALTEGFVMSGSRVAIAATLGKSTLKVSRQPKAALLSTGDELVPVAQQPELHQIRMSNGPALRAGLTRMGWTDNSMRHLKDDPKHMEQEIRRALEENDLVVLTGGVSKGKFDYVPELLEKLKVEKVFHQVAQKPGKPLWYGIFDDDGRRVPVVGLPGNPMAVVVCFYKYLIPLIYRMLAARPIYHPLVPLTGVPPLKPGLTHFVPSRLTREGLAEPVSHHGSGDLLNLAHADGFVELEPETTSSVETGTEFATSGKGVPWYAW